MNETSRIAEITAERVDIPMRRPFESAKRLSTVTELVRVTARLHGGQEGRGEASPASYVTGEDAADIQAAAAPGAPLRLDGNQGFQPAGALEFVNRLLAAGVPVELLEQPVDRSDWDGLARVSSRSPVPVIADEAVLTPAEALRVAATGAAHGI